MQKERVLFTHMRRVKVPLVALSVGLVMACAAGGAAVADSTNEPITRPSIAFVTLDGDPSAPSDAAKPIEFIPKEALPDGVGLLPTNDFVNWLNLLQEALGSVDAYGYVAVGEDRASVDIYWYGTGRSSSSQRLWLASSSYTAAEVTLGAF